MAQIVKSQTISVGQKMIVLKKPNVSNRIFFSIYVVRAPADWSASLVSFGDPLFRSYFVLDGSLLCFEAKGEGIFQGDIWVSNVSSKDLLFTMTEILV